MRPDRSQGADAGGRVIRSDMTRHPALPLHPATRAGLIEIPPHRSEVLSWAK